MVFDLRNDLTHEVHEVLLDHTDDVEAIGDDLGVGEVPADQGAIGEAQIHADDADVFFAFERAEVGVKFLRVTAFDDIEDPMGSQIAKSRGELGAAPVAGSLAMDGVLVNAEDGRADTVRTFPGFDLGVFVDELFQPACQHHHGRVNGLFTTGLQNRFDNIVYPIAMPLNDAGELS